MTFKKGKRKKTITIFKRKIRKSTLFLLAITLIANSFAWFIYTNKVSNNITTGIKSWKVTFDQNGTDLEDVISFNIDSIYPGMPDYNDYIKITNSGEMVAYVTYEIHSVKIFGETYTNEEYTSEEIQERLANLYPFKITFAVDNPEIVTSGTDSVANFSVNVTWPFESGDDELDTLWGKQSYRYKQLHPDEDQIVIVVKIKASQNQA